MVRMNSSESTADPFFMPNVLKCLRNENSFTFK